MLTLIVPGLIWTRQALTDLTCDLPLPAFTSLLGKGRLRHLPPQTAAAMLAECAGLATPLPAAALRRLALAGKADRAEWLCLDPIGLRFADRSLVVDAPRHLSLGADEASALATALAPLLADLGELELLAGDAWNLRLARTAPSFQPLSEAAGRAAAPLPADPAYAPWRHVISEAQVLLHAHAVNRARAAAGQPLVNSLWPWGGGRLPPAGAGPHDLLWSTDPVAQGIARLLQIDCATPPARFSPVSTRHPLAIHDALEAPARSGDALVWRDQLARFEADWLAPALAALRAGKLDALRLLAPGETAAAELRVSREDSWRFWRKPLALSALVEPVAK